MQGGAGRRESERGAQIRGGEEKDDYLTRLNYVCTHALTGLDSICTPLTGLNSICTPPEIRLAQSFCTPRGVYLEEVQLYFPAAPFLHIRI